MKKRKSTAFIVELFLLFVILIMVITVITAVLVRARGKSREARQLTGGVICAENTAEVLASARSAQEGAELISRMEDVSDVVCDGDEISVAGRYGKGDSGIRYQIRVEMNAEHGGRGNYVEKFIRVYEEGEKKALYELTGGNYIRDDARTGGEEP